MLQGAKEKGCSDRCKKERESGEREEVGEERGKDTLIDF